MEEMYYKKEIVRKMHSLALSLALDQGSYALQLPVVASLPQFPPYSPRLLTFMPLF